MGQWDKWRKTAKNGRFGLGQMGLGRDKHGKQLLDLLSPRWRRYIGGMGRPDTYTKEMAERICLALASSSKGLRGTLDADPELPPYDTVQGWLYRHDEFKHLYAQAKSQQLDAMAEDIIDISDSDELDTNDKRVRVDTRKWLLAKLKPRTYGDKLDVTSGGEQLAVPSHQIDARVQSIIMQAQARRLGALPTPEDIPPEALDLLE